MELLTLFFSGFSSSTLLPGSSEALFLYLLAQANDPAWLLILVVGIGNSLGGMTNWIIGYLIRKGLWKDKLARDSDTIKNSRSKTARSENSQRIRAEKWLEQHGAPVLFFSFLPVIGDPLCLVAGLVNINAYKALLYITLGKFSRYVVMAYIVV